MAKDKTNLEQYLVKFWIKNDKGFLEQKSEMVKIVGKGMHEEAEKLVRKKYANFQRLVNVISC